MGFDVADGVYGETTTAAVTGEISAKGSKVDGDVQMWVRAACSQGGEVVYRQTVAVADGTAELQLGPTRSWTGGAADCTADLGSFDHRGRWRSEATDAFHTAG